MDYTITKMPSYNGDGKSVPSIEVFNPVSGETICFCRRRHYESKEAWIARALSTAEEHIAD